MLKVFTCLSNKFSFGYYISGSGRSATIVICKVCKQKREIQGAAAFFTL